MTSIDTDSFVLSGEIRPCSITLVYGKKFMDFLLIRTGGCFGSIPRSDEKVRGDLRIVDMPVFGN